MKDWFGMSKNGLDAQWMTLDLRVHERDGQDEEIGEDSYMLRTSGDWFNGHRRGVVRMMIRAFPGISCQTNVRPRPCRSRLLSIQH